MSKYVIHIGAGKAGSSSIQGFLRNNHQALGVQGFLVPDNKLSVGGPVTGEHVWGMEGLIQAEDPGAVADRLSALETAAGDRTILISAENLSNLGSSRVFGNSLAERTCSVIFYIRRQDEYLMSAWQQWYSKVENDLSAWLIKALVQHGHWGRVINEWQNAIGPGAVHVRIFDREEFVEGDLIKDYCACAGIDSSDEDVNTNVSVENISFSDAITDLITGAPSLFSGAHDNEFYNMIGSLTGRDFVPQKKVSLISRNTRESIMYYYREENQSVCRNYFKGRQHLFRPIDHNQYQYLSDDDLRRQQLQFLTRLVFEISKRR